MIRSEHYQVVFSGMVAEGHEPESVRRKFAALFKVRRECVGDFFTGVPVVIKKGLSRQEADTYLANLERIGAISCIEADREAERETSASSLQIAGGTEDLECPSCGFPQLQTDVCAWCGEGSTSNTELTLRSGSPPLKTLRAPQRRRHAGSTSVAGLVVNALFYPLAGSGLMLLMVGTLFFVVMDFLSLLPGVGLVISLFTSGYLAAYMMKVITSSADGDLSPPDWPEFTDWSASIARPLAQVAGAVIFVYSPFLAALLYSYVYESDVPKMLLLALVAAGTVYLPMALLAVAMYRSLGALHPIFLTQSMLKIGPRYLFASLVLALAIGGGLLVEGAFLKIPLAGHLLGGLLSLYFLMVEMRIIGLIYHAHIDQLRWFGEA